MEENKRIKLVQLLKIIVFPLLCIGVIILIDQLTKLYFKNNYEIGQKTEIISGFFDFKYVQNTGSAFSMFADKSWGQTFFKILTPIALVCMLLFYWINRKNGPMLIYGLVFIIGGTVGNFIDRLAYSYVVDFLSFTFGTYKFAIFNIADTFLCVGIFMIFVHYLFLDKDAIFKKKIKENAKNIDENQEVSVEENG